MKTQLRKRQPDVCWLFLVFLLWVSTKLFDTNPNLIVLWPPTNLFKNTAKTDSLYLDGRKSPGMDALAYFSF